MVLCEVHTKRKREPRRNSMQEACILSAPVHPVGLSASDSQNSEGSRFAEPPH